MDHFALRRENFDHLLLYFRFMPRVVPVVVVNGVDEKGITLPKLHFAIGFLVGSHCTWPGVWIRMLTSGIVESGEGAKALREV